MPNVSELLALCTPGESAKFISFASLWFLFVPGSLIVERKSDPSYSKVFKIDTVQPSSRKIDRKGRFVYGTFGLDCHAVSYVGGDIGILSSSKRVEVFQGVIAISELSFIPLSSLEEHEEKRKRFISRGQKFWDLRGQHMKEHVDSSYTNRSLVVRSFSFSSDYALLHDHKCDQLEKNGNEPTLSFFFRKMNVS